MPITNEKLPVLFLHKNLCSLSQWVIKMYFSVPVLFFNILAVMIPVVILAYTGDITALYRSFFSGADRAENTEWIFWFSWSSCRLQSYKGITGRMTNISVIESKFSSVRKYLKILARYKKYSKDEITAT